ncbi:antirestriction protein ArdA [uncultured Dysosmobacter sp.]|uniref:antirestriction protein ArdA n=1 Tax=uncultured Dysosmobacter sp. TaxID=2591384 RepID=UPI002604BB57|nr:antirestriction protein ArdA [uncultured Dysosmobacter sp.]
MDKVFHVELYSKNDLYCELDLPATPYQLLDALERIRASPGEEPSWEICEYYDFAFLSLLIAPSFSFYELNALAQRLSELDRRQSISFEGLVQMEIDKRDGPIRCPRLIDLAYSADCCHVLPEALNDSQLGRFYAENGFIPSVENVPDSIFELLDFERLGREARIGEGGVFTSRGYVCQDSDLEEVFDSLDLTPKKPAYPILIEMRCGDRSIPLPLPAAQADLDTALDAVRAAGWPEVSIRCRDCQVPSLMDAVEKASDIEQINCLAEELLHMEPAELSKYKAVLSAAACDDAEEAVLLSKQLDNYILEPETRSPEDVAMGELRVSVDEETLRTLLPHVKLYPYGQALLDQRHSALTDYGLVERRDGQPIQALAGQPQRGGMEMS